MQGQAHQRHAEARCTRPPIDARVRRRRPAPACPVLLAPAEPVLAPAVSVALLPGVHRVTHDGGVLLPVNPVAEEPALLHAGRITAQGLGDELGLGRARMQAILDRWPHHAQLDPEHVNLTLQALASVLQIRPGDAAALVSHEPRLLHTHPATIRAAVIALASTFNIPTSAMLLVTLSRPGILFEDPATALVRLQACAAALQVSLPQLLEGGSQEPWLLIAPADTLAARAAHLHKTFLLQPGPKLLTKYARLLCIRPEDLEAKVQTLCTALRLQPQNTHALVLSCPKILKFSAASLEAHATGLLALMPLRLLQHVVFQEPMILTKSCACLAQRVSLLQRLLNCTREQILELVERRPNLLTRSERSLKGSFNALSIWKLDGDFKRQLVISHPLLLRLSSQELHGRCRWLRELMLSNGFFHSALRRATPAMLGLTIMHLPDCWSRLQYLADSGRETGQDLLTVVQTSHLHFPKVHPGYTKWMQWKCMTQGCSIPWHNNQHLQQTYGWKRRPTGRQHNAAARSSLPVASRQRQGIAAQASAQMLHHQQRHHAQAAAAGYDSQGGSASEGEQEGDQPTKEVVEIHEAQTLCMGKHFVHKPKRVFSRTVPVRDPMLPGA